MGLETPTRATYSANEMLRLAREAVPTGHRWDAGVKPIEGSPIGLAITYLIGEPVPA